MLDINKRLLITSDNQKQKNRVINLLKLIPKLKKTKKFKYERPIFKSRNKIFFNSSLFQKEAKSEKDDFKMNNITLINMSDLNNNSIKSFNQQQLSIFIFKLFNRDLEVFNEDEFKDIIDENFRKEVENLIEKQKILLKQQEEKRKKEEEDRKKSNKNN